MDKIVKCAHCSNERDMEVIAENSQGRLIVLCPVCSKRSEVIGSEDKT